MAGETTRLKLIKPTGGDLIKILDLSTNFDTLDNSPGTYICTSTTRPAAPFEGQRIWEEDTKRGLVRVGAAWEIVSWPASENSVTSDLITDGTGNWEGQFSIVRTSGMTGLMSGFVRRKAAAAYSYTADAAFINLGVTPADAFTGTKVWAKPTAVIHTATTIQVPSIMSGSGANFIAQLNVSHSVVQFRHTASFSWAGSSAQHAWLVNVPVRIQGS